MLDWDENAGLVCLSDQNETETTVHTTHSLSKDIWLYRFNSQASQSRWLELQVNCITFYSYFISEIKNFPKRNYPMGLCSLAI